jgi:hypothetical protein
VRITSIASSNPLGRLRGRDAEAGEFVSPIALADPEIEPAIRQQVEGRGLLGDQDRVVPRQHDDRGAEPDALGTRRQIGEQAHRRRDLAKTGEMVLDEKDARKTELLGLDDVIYEVVIGGAVARRATASARPAEKPESHPSASSRVVARIYGAIRIGSMTDAGRPITAM